MLLFFVLLQYVFVIIFCMVAKVLLCSYQGVLNVFFFFATVCFVIIFRMVAKVLLCSYQGVLNVFFFLLQYVLL